jgi:sortase A
MGYVNIPSIGVNLPVYHGVDEVHLQVAVGHIEGSSLPVGGPSTHCVVSAHRGLPSAKLFTDLDQVKEGDIFTFTVLDQTLTYEVDQIRIVEPNNLSDLEIQKDADYATLITCTPYGVNTHRMLVRGHRIENLSDRTVVPAGAVQIPVYVAVLAVGIPLLFVYLVFALIYYRRRRPELDTQKALETVRKHAMDVQTDKNVASDGADEDAMSKEE